MEEGNFTQAVFYYKAALLCEKNERGGGFCQPDCYDFIPYLQLCVCYDRLGDKKQAEKYNNLAEKIKPQHPSVVYNKKYFESL